MHIAMFTPGYHSVTRDTVKATEYFIYKLSEELKTKGHEVTIFSEAKSDDSFNIVSPKYDIDINNQVLNSGQFGQYLVANMCDFIDYCNQNNVDILHDHTTTFSCAIARYSKAPVVTTLHGIRENNILSEYYQKNKFMHYIAPSEYVKKMSPDFNFSAVIPHGLDVSKYEFNNNPSDEFLHIGRIIAEKGQMDAIEAADISGEKLRLGGYLPEYMKDDSYYKEVIETASKSPNVNFIGKVERNDVPEEMARAKALLMPIKYDEAFGLVMIEAMASGTPVIAYNTASAPEIIEDGVTGYLVEPDNPKSMAEAMNKIDQIDRKKCREHVEDNFSLNKMVNNYIDVYKNISKKEASVDKIHKKCR